MMAQSNPMVRAWHVPYHSFNDFFVKNGVRAQVFKIDPARRTTIIGKKGTRLTFYPFSFASLPNRPVDGEVTITLLEVFTKKEMVLSDKVTTSEDRLLESGGQICLLAHQGYEPLHLLQPVTVDLPVREKLRNAVAMHLFVGSTAITRAFRAKRVFDWRQTSNRPVAIKKIAKKKHYHFQVNDLNWWNCDYFFSKRTTRTMVSARPVCHIEKFDEVVAYLVFRDLNSVTRMHSGAHSFTSFNIPINQSATVVMMGLYQKQLYFGRHSIDKTSNQVVYVNMEPISEPQLLTALEEL